MNTRRRMVMLGMAAAALAACSRQGQPGVEAPPEAAPGAPIADPAAIIRPLYDRYMTPAAVTTFPTLEEQAPWSDELRTQLIDMMARSAIANEPILDFDPFTGAQDWQLSDLNVVTDGVVENSHAVVRASFTNFGAAEEVVFDLVWQEGEWRVDNIRNALWDLRQVIAQ